ncbi:MAG: hypothetical protein HY905_25120 [Deltaproteobacteria bacterium]|nr:hypothetical protein [Deltaproteobacteria bacterium]
MIREDLEVLAGRRRRLAAVASALLVFVGLVFGFAMGLRDAPLHLLAWPSLALGGVAVAAVSLAFGAPLIHRRRLAMVAAACLVVAAVAVIAVAGSLGRVGPRLLEGWPCAATELGLGTALVVLALLLGRSVLRRRGPVGVLVGGAAAASGLLGLHLHCPMDDASHLAVHHLLAAGLVVAAAVLLLRRPQ